MFNNRYFVLGLLVATTMATIFLTAIVGLAWSAIGSMGAKDAPAPNAPIPHLSENLRGELNSALTPEFPFNFDTVGNPFADTSGVSLAVSKTSPNSAVGMSMLPNGSSQIAAFPGQGAAAVRPAFPRGGQRQGVMPMPNYTGGVMPQAMQNIPNMVAANNQPAPNAGNETSELIKERQRQVKLGREVPALASFYSIDDLRPYGIVGSGDNNRVKLISTSTKARFPVASGTKFRDGTIVGISDEGVSFRRGSGEVVVKRWMKNKDTSAGNAMQADAPVMRVEKRPVAPQLSENSPH